MVDVRTVIYNAIRQVKHKAVVERGYEDAATDAVLAALASAGIVLGTAAELEDYEQAGAMYAIKNLYDLGAIGLALIRTGGEG